MDKPTSDKDVIKAFDSEPTTFWTESYNETKAKADAIMKPRYRLYWDFDNNRWECHLVSRKALYFKGFVY